MLKPSNSIPKGNLRYVVGDATLPIGGSLRYILQVCNDIGAYGAGFSGALSRKWPTVESKYRMWWRERQGSLKLGDIQEIMVQSDIRVINMIGQHGVINWNGKPGTMSEFSTEDGLPPIRYDALEECLSKAGILISQEKGAAHMPRIGCGLAGGKWENVEPLIVEQLNKRGINVTVYDFDG